MTTDKFYGVFLNGIFSWSIIKYEVEEQKKEMF